MQEQADDERAFLRAFLQLDAVQRTLLTLRAEGHDLQYMVTPDGQRFLVVTAPESESPVYVHGP
jgi:hypothetical protein